MVGGEGAPLIPYLDWILFEDGTYAVNLGGIANVTYVSERFDGVIAFDIQGFHLIPSHLWALSLLTTAEACAAQWWVVRRRSRQWSEPVSSQGLLLACILAKTVTAILWAFCPFAITRL